MSDKKAYLYIDGSAVRFHTDIDAAHEAGLGDPDKTVDLDEFEAAGCICRIIDGAIFLGKTDEEKKEDKAAEIREERNRRIKEEVDPMQGVLIWGSLSAEAQTAWTEYRCALLDVPEQSTFPESVIWPEKPVYGGTK